MATDILLLRIAGVGTLASGQTVFATRSVPYLTADVSLVSWPEIPGCSLRPLHGLASSSGFSIKLRDTTAVLGLLSRPPEPFRAADNTPVRLDEFFFRLGSSAVAVTDTTPFAAATVPNPIAAWTSHEVLEVTGVSGSDITLAAAGTLGTGSKPHPMVAGRGPMLYPSCPNVIGRRCTLHRTTTDATLESQEELIWSGYVDSIEDGVSAITLRVESAIGKVRKTKYQPPRASGVVLRHRSTSQGGATNLYMLEQPFVVDSSTYGGTAWGHVRLTRSDGYWWVFAVSSVGTDTYDISDSYVARGGPEISRPGGVGTVGVLEQDRGLAAGESVVCSAEMVLAWSTSVKISDVLEALLTASARVGITAQLDPRDIDSDALWAVDDIGRLGTNTSSGTDTFITPPWSGTIGEIIDKQLLGPAGGALALNSSGQIQAIDWRETEIYSGVTTEIAASDLRGMPEWGQGARDLARMVTLLPSAPDSRRVEITSDRAVHLWSSGETLDYQTDLWAEQEYPSIGSVPPAIIARWISLIYTYGDAAPIVSAPVSESIDLEPGDTTRVSVPIWPGSSSSRGVVDSTAVVLERRRRLEDRTLTYRLLLIGHMRAPTVWLGVYSPAARSSTGESAGATTINVEANVYTETTAPGSLPTNDAESWLPAVSLSPRVLLCDANLVAKHNNTVTLSGVGVNTLTIDTAFTAAGVPVVIASGDVILYAHYNDQPTAIQARYAAMADTAGTLGSGADTGVTYR